MTRVEQYDAMLRGDDFAVDVNELSWAIAVLDSMAGEVEWSGEDREAFAVAIAACEALYRAANRIVAAG